jgi:acetyltransferase-like isoleucine patch superfamily enzyme
MAAPLLARLRTWLRIKLMSIRTFYLAKAWGMDIGRDCCISFSARLDKTHPRGIHIGDETAINFDAVILTHEAVNNRALDTWIGKRCQIGARSIVMPGVRIGDGSIVSPASVVIKDVPAGSLVTGNPARVIEAGLQTGPHGRRAESWEVIVAAENAARARKA